MNFKFGNLVKNRARQTKPSNEHTICFHNNKLCIKHNKRFYFVEDAYNLDYYVGNVYSLPNNDKHKAWTKASISKPVLYPHLVNLYWAKYKPGMKVSGEVKNGIFIIN